MLDIPPPVMLLRAWERPFRPFKVQGRETVIRSPGLSDHELQRHQFRDVNLIVVLELGATRPGDQDARGASDQPRLVRAGLALHHRRSVFDEEPIAFLENREMPSRNLVRLLRVGQKLRQVRAANQPLGRGNRLFRVVGKDQVARLGRLGREVFLGLRCLGGAFVLDVREVGGALVRRVHRIGGGFWFSDGFGAAGVRAKHRVDRLFALVRRGDRSLVHVRRGHRAFILSRHRGELQFGALGFDLDLRAAHVAELRAFPVLAVARRTLCHVHHRFGFFFPMIVVACRKSFFAASLSWSPLRATVAWASRIVVATSLNVGFARMAVAAPASVAMVRMIVSAFWSAVASRDCTARCMRTVASAELKSVRGYGLVSAFHRRWSSVNATSTSWVTSTKENRSKVAFPAGRDGTPIRNTRVCSSPAIRSRSGTVKAAPSNFGRGSRFRTGLTVYASASSEPGMIETFNSGFETTVPAIWAAWSWKIWGRSARASTM